MINLIIKTIKEYVDVDENQITKDTNFLLDLHLTSFDIVSMVGELEDDLGIEIPDSMLKKSRYCWCARRVSGKKDFTKEFMR